LNLRNIDNCSHCGASLQKVTPTLVDDPDEEHSPVTERMANIRPIQRVPIRCPFCGSNAGTRIESRVSNGGKIFAIVLLLFLCLPLFWIGLLIREDVIYCLSCNMKLA